MSPSEKKARGAAPPDPEWDVVLSRKTAKQVACLPPVVFRIFEVLIEDLQEHGPEQKDWPNFGPLKGQKGQKKGDMRYRCHLKRGRPTYVACWHVVGKSIEIEVYYAGTHEKAPY